MHIYNIYILMSEIINDNIVEQNVKEGQINEEANIEEQKKLLCNEENKGRSKLNHYYLKFLFHSKSTVA